MAALSNLLFHKFVLVYIALLLLLEGAFVGSMVVRTLSVFPDFLESTCEMGLAHAVGAWIWFVGSLLCLFTVAYGSYLAVLRNRLRNPYLFIHLFFLCITYSVRGEKHSWILLNLDMGYVYGHFGLGLNLVGFVLLFFYLVLLRQETRYTPTIEI